MIIDFQDDIWKYLSSVNLIEEVDNSFNLIKENSNRLKKNNLNEVNIINWLIFYNQLPTYQQKFLQNNQFIVSAIKNKFKELHNYTSLKFYKSLLSQTPFTFLNSTQKIEISECMFDFIQLSIDYINGELINEWNNNPENWIIYYLSLNNSKRNKNDMYHWLLAKVINQLGFNCYYSTRSYYLYIYYTNQPVDTVYLKFKDWVGILKSLDSHEQGCKLECAIELFISSNFKRQKFIQHVFPMTKEIDEIESVKKDIFFNNENKISDIALIRYLYNLRLNRDIVNKEAYKSLFNDIDTDFISIENKKSIDWISFWRGMKLINLRQKNYIINKSKHQIKWSFDSSKKVDIWFRSIFTEQKQESLWCMVLDNKNKLIEYREITRGTIDQTIAHPREIFAFAIRVSGNGIILIHNHPSGDPKPSIRDHEVTKRIMKSGQLLGIKVHDHVIIGKLSHYSFMDNEIKPS